MDEKRQKRGRIEREIELEEGLWKGNGGGTGRYDEHIGIKRTM